MEKITDQLKKLEINVKPFLKWVGGKTQIINKVIKLFPNKCETYHEIFLGGGSVLFAVLQNKKYKNIKAYDLNETLIHLYKNIQKDYKKVLNELNKLITEFKIFNEIKREKKEKIIKPNKIEDVKSREMYYYYTRNKYNSLTQKEKNGNIGSAYFIFLNKTCFRGVYRIGPNGFNVPYGHYKNPKIVNENNVKQISKLIKNVEFIVSDFSESIANVNENDFIYLDPPYVPENSKSFVGYNKEGFKLEQHKKLFNLCLQMKNKFVMSNSDTELITKTFVKFTIKKILCKRSINSKKPNAKCNEVLIWNFK